MQTTDQQLSLFLLTASNSRSMKMVKRQVSTLSMTGFRSHATKETIRALTNRQLTTHGGTQKVTGIKHELEIHNFFIFAALLPFCLRGLPRSELFATAFEVGGQVFLQWKNAAFGGTGGDGEATWCLVPQGGRNTKIYKINPLRFVQFV